MQRDEVMDVQEPEILEAEVVETAAALLPNRKGMTLVEIMIVLTILAGVMVAVGVYAFDALDRGNIQTTRVKLEKISSKVQEFYAFQSPSGMPSGLDDLIKPPGGEPPYLREEDLKDAWGQPIEMSVSGREYEIRSPGPDGNSGNDDDVVNSSAK